MQSFRRIMKTQPLFATTKTSTRLWTRYYCGAYLKPSVYKEDKVFKEPKERVLVTGINGFIGSWVANKLLEKSEYDVVGSVLDQSNTTQLEALKQGLGEEKFSKLTFLTADMSKPETIRKAVEDSQCKYIIHLASPFPIVDPVDENEVIEPAVTGTKTILEAALENGVKRVVVTSSCATMESFKKDTEITANEDSWHDPSGYTNTYYKSKNLAEKAAWNFYNNLSQEEKQRFGLWVINPGFVLGPLLAKLHGTSQMYITGFMDGTISEFPHIYSEVVDVRDVADAHIKGLTCESGHRIAVSGGNYTFVQVSDVIKQKYNKEGYNMNLKHASRFKYLLKSLYDKNTYEAYKRWKARCIVDNSKAKKMLNIDFIPMKKSVLDMAESLFALGFVQKLQKS